MARTVSVKDTGRLRFVGESGGRLVEEGRATGTLPGSARAKLTLGTSTVRVAFTLYLSGGSMSGQGTAKLNVGKGEYASFSGGLTVTHGSGRYAHASGSGKIYGTINRTSDDAVVQVEGRLRY